MNNASLKEVWEREGERKRGRDRERDSLVPDS